MKELADIGLTYLLSPVVGISLSIVLLVDLVLSPLLSNEYFQAYRSLFNNYQKAYWNTLAVSILHAILACTLIIYCFISGSIDTSDMIHSYSPLGILCMQISAGYFMGDFSVCLSQKPLREVSTVLHHISSLLSMILGLLFKGRWSILILARLFSELSTPFVHMWWVCNNTKIPKSSPWFLFASTGMTVTFYISRVFTIPFFWYIIINIISQEMNPQLTTYIPFWIQILVVVMTSILDCLNLYWSYKMARGCHKLMRNQKKIN